MPKEGDKTEGFSEAALSYDDAAIIVSENTELVKKVWLLLNGLTHRRAKHILEMAISDLPDNSTVKV